MRCLVFLLYCYLQLVYRTCRWESLGYGGVQFSAAENSGQIFVFWHGRLAMMPFFAPIPSRTYVISSRSRDGEISALLMRWFGIQTIRGSSRKKGSTKERGGRHVLVESVRLLKGGAAVAVTPDGPRGPRMRVNGHVLSMASMSGAAIIPIAYATTRGILCDTWDRFFLPLPFGRGYYSAGAPIHIPHRADAETLEKYRLKVEDALNDLIAQVDRAAKRKETPTAE